MKRLIYPLIIGVMVMGGWKFYNFKNQYPIVTEESSIAVELATPKTVTGLGKLKPKGEIVAIAAPVGANGSRVEQLLVKEGDYLEKGQIIAIMDNHERLKAALESAKIEVAFAEAKLQQVKAGAKEGEIAAQRAEIERLQADQEAQIRVQEATVNKLKAEVKNAATEFDRYQYLYQQGAISASLKDSKKLILETSTSNLQQAEAELNRLKNTQSPQLETAQATLEKIKEVRPVDIAVASQEVNRALANVKKAETELAQTEVKATQRGIVLDILTLEGETVSDRGIVEVGDTNSMSVTAEIYETDIKRVKIGQNALISSDALPQILQGKVATIGSKVQQQNILNTDPSATIDNRIIEVEISLDEDSSQIARNFSNLQVTVEIKQ